MGRDSALRCPDAAAQRPYLNGFQNDSYGIRSGYEFRFMMEMPMERDDYARPATPPDTSNLTEVREASHHCTACHLYKRATQTVFGEGPKNASIMLVGEQPGDYEDVSGRPFVWTRRENYGPGA
jgi:hypothetical protein